MVRFNIECPLAFPADDFWRVRDSPSFNRFIVADGMLKSITISEPVVDDEGWTTREQQYCPNKVECPDFIRAIIGDTMFEVKDFHRWNEHVKPNHLSYRIQPTFLTSLSETKGELSLLPFPCPEHSSAGKDAKQLSDASLAKPHDDAAPGDAALGDATPDDAAPDDAAPDDAPLDDASPGGDDVDLDAVQSPRKEVDSNAQKSSSRIDAIDSKSIQNAMEAGSEIDSTENEGNDFDTPDATDSSDDEGTSAVEALANLDRLPPTEKSIFRVAGLVRVRILTLGWFVERAIVHNLRLFYKEYPATVYRFRCKLYRDFANGDTSVPISQVVDRLLAWEASVAEKRNLKVQAEKKRELEKGHESDISQHGTENAGADGLPEYLSTEKAGSPYVERPDASLLSNE